MLSYTGLSGADDPGFQPDVLSTPNSGRSHARPEPFEHGCTTQLDAIAPVNPLVAKLASFTCIDQGDVAAIESIAGSAKPNQSGKILFHEGSVPDHVYLFVRGMACRYKLLPSGRRQILGFLIPGDLCDIQFLARNPPDHSVALLSDAQLVKIPNRRIRDLLADRPRIDRALALAALQEFSILREWLLNVGQRNALEKLAHFFCEMKIRLQSVGQVDADDSFDLPVNQMTLADTTGLTPVHVNRTLQRLRSDGLIQLRHRRLQIINFDRLAAVAGFDANYLLARQGQE